MYFFSFVILFVSPPPLLPGFINVLPLSSSPPQKQNQFEGKSLLLLTQSLQIAIESIWSDFAGIFFIASIIMYSDLTYFECISNRIHVHHKNNQCQTFSCTK
jgi:hypothetical protein